MPGFDTLGARLARSRRRLERERAATVEQAARDGLDGAVQSENASTAQPARASTPGSAQVIRFPRLNERDRN